jgi:hypothetical protein
MAGGYRPRAPLTLGQTNDTDGVEPNVMAFSSDGSDRYELITHVYNGPDQLPIGEFDHHLRTLRSEIHQDRRERLGRRRMFGNGRLELFLFTPSFEPKSPGGMFVIGMILSVHGRLIDVTCS